MAKKEKLETLVPPEEQPYPVPENWRWVRLGNVVKIKRGASPRPIKSYITEDGNGVNWIKIGDTDSGKYITVTKERVTQSGADKSVFVEKGTLLLSNSMSFGRPYILNIDGCIHDGWLAITPSDVLDKEYLYYALLASRWYFESVAVGTAVRNLNSDRVAATPVVLPPKDEQERIVVRIESLFAKLDEAKEKAQAVVDGFEDRKAAILHKAFTGELTEQWRKEKNLSLDQWQYVKWGSFLKSIEAGKNWNALGRPPEGDEFGVVKVSAVTWGEFEEKESKTCTEQSQWNDRIQIKLGDFLFSRANTIQLVGNCVIVRDVHKRLMLSDKILRFNMSSLVDPEYILFFTRSDLYRNQIEELASGNQDGMRNVSQANLKKIEFPIPSKEEQLQIVKLLSNFHNKANISKQVAKKVIDDIDGMKKSILAKAFRGELGTNDPTEPSVELPQ